MSLSLCTIALDEQQLLGGMLDSVAGLVDEIWLGIDSRTTDSTRQVAVEFAERTLVRTHAFVFDWHDSFAEARNLVLERARGDWILALDADEQLLPGGRAAIQDTLAQDVPLVVDGYRVMLQDVARDGWPLEPAEVIAARLFRNSPDLRYVGRIHEEIRFVPVPSRTRNAILPGGPHVRHVGADPDLMRQRGKRARDRRLLHLRLRDNPRDAVAYAYLARMAHADGRRLLARMFAQRALGCGPRTLHDEAVAGLQRLL